VPQAAPDKAHNLCYFGSSVASCDAPGGSLEEFMKSLALKVRNFLVSEDGPTAVEYAVMLALIIIVCLTAISAIGTNADTTFQTIADSIATAS
jgi:pilus assembly protein Flp/PilA